MSSTKLVGYPEPVPPASQLAVLPFLAAVEGYLREEGDVKNLHITCHRAMSREGLGYLQQICAYLKQDGGQWRNVVGRTFSVNEGIMGAAYDDGRIWRTPTFPNRDALLQALHEKNIDPERIAMSWLAVPFLGPEGQVVLVLYADCDELNFFADDARVRRVVAMSKGFCKLLDWLQDDPFEVLRNYPLEKGTPVCGTRTVYPIQQPMSNLSPPRFRKVSSFNYEAAVA